MFSRWQKATGDKIWGRGTVLSLELSYALIIGAIYNLPIKESQAGAACEVAIGLQHEQKVKALFGSK